MAATSLIIGKSRNHRHEISRILESTRLFGHILEGANHREATAKLQSNRVDLILYGAENLAKEGSKLARLLDGQAEWRDIPVLAFTREGNEEERIIVLESGASDCLSYDTSARELEARIRRYLQNKRRLDQLRRANEALARQSLTDELTRLGNRRFFEQTVEAEAARSNRNGEPFSLMLVDLDHFKSINDTYGHQVGDAVLKAVASALRYGIRKPDTVCRFGGEEFALVMPGTSAAGARLVGERIRNRIASLTQKEMGIDVRVTASIGISSGERGRFINPDQIIMEADEALYCAKDRGRNRTEVHAGDNRFFAPPLFGENPGAPLARAM